MKLYTTDGCSLCEEVLGMLDVLGVSPGQLESIDIVFDDALLEELGSRIPVLEKDGGQRLYWPFSLLDLQLWYSD